jgi:hypothetical protein
MDDSYADEYKELFDKFVFENNLDLDDKFWTIEQRKEWAQIFTSFQYRWRRESFF